MNGRIAVLGGGMLGVCTALELAHRGRNVTLLEGAADVMEGASRWNEGKIHLGFLYAADASMSTAMRLIPGGLAFFPLLSRLLGRRLEEFCTTDDDLFLVHRQSIVDGASFRSYAERVASLLRDATSQIPHSSYVSDLRRAAVRLLTPMELSTVTPSEDVIAAFRVPERSISTIPIADLLRQALLNEPRVGLRTSTWIAGVERRDDGRLDVSVGRAQRSTFEDGPFDIVINALWEGRPLVDASIDIHPPGPWSHRFRVAAFAQNATSNLQSAVVCTGPFGDVKRYADGRAYLSWYEAGLIAQGTALEPPRRAATLTAERRADVLRSTLASLGQFFPAVLDFTASRGDAEVHGGWVYAVGQGSLADPASTLHRRDRFNMTIDGGYISVDTAKYSLAPWLAAQVADTVSPQ